MKILYSVLISLFAGVIAAQSFAPPVPSPFSIGIIDSAGGFVAVGDIDDDGDFDVLVACQNHTLYYFKNIGDSISPVFDTASINPFGLSPSGLGMPLPFQSAMSLVDLDDDNDLDLCIGVSGTWGEFFYSENIGTSAIPFFDSLKFNQFGNPSNFLDFHPALIDLDADGDYDMLAGDYGGGLNYFENTGSESQPNFANGVYNPFGLKGTKFYAAPTFGDLDGDGDFDLLVGDTTAGFNYYENTGSDTVPQFAVKINNPFGLVDMSWFAKPCFIDLDGDGDLDILASDIGPHLYFFENLTVVNNTRIVENDGLSVSVFPNPSQGVFTIQSAVVIESVEVLDLLGRSVKIITNPRCSVDINDLPKGEYLVKIMAVDGTSGFSRLIKN